MTIVFIIRFIIIILAYHLVGSVVNIMYWDYISNHPNPNLKLGKFLAIVFIPLIYLFSRTLKNYLK